MKLKLTYLIMVAIIAWSGSVLAAEPETAPKGFIKADQVNLRNAPSLSGTIITTLSLNTEVTIVAQDDNWFKVHLTENSEGWVAKDYVALGGAPVNRGIGFVDLISFAKNFLHTHYSWGGSSPNGFDCSGFTKYIFSKFGFILPHNAAQQAKLGAPVAKDNLLPGDLVFFNGPRTSYIDHVGIYIGNNQFIHASSAQGIVTITSLDTNYYVARYRGAKRIAENLNMPL